MPLSLVEDRGEAEAGVEDGGLEVGLAAAAVDEMGLDRVVKEATT